MTKKSMKIKWNRTKIRPSGIRLAIEIVRRQNEVVLKVGDRPFLRVAEADTVGALYPENQGEIWQKKLQEGLNKSWRERTADYTRWAFKQIAIAFFVALLLQVLLILLCRHVQQQQARQSPGRWGSLKLLILILLQIGVWVVFIIYSARLFPITREWFYYLIKLLDSTFNNRIFQLGEEAISLNRVLVLILMVAALWIGVGWFVRLLRSRLLTLTAANRSHQDAIAFFVRYSLLFIGVLLVLNAGGIDFQSLAFLLGAIGVGIGFGLQNIAKDFISGLILIVARPIKIGELVQVGEFQGLVLRIGARTTEISHVDRHIITVPNSRFIEGEVLNWNRSGLTRVKAYINVSYGSDIEFVSKVLLAAAQVEHPDILRHPPPKVKFREYAEDGLQFRVVAFISDPLKQPKVRTHLYSQIERYLRRYGIEIARPQQELYLKDLDPEISAGVRSQTPENDRPQPREFLPLEEPEIREEYDWDAIAAAMRGPEGVPVKDRRFQFKIFPDVFLGSDAVEWLMVQERATREEAILMGQLMLEMGIIESPLNEQTFKDDPSFYRFSEEAEIPPASP
ncbi:mechanosensitive ion channel domain-containing protein [Lyngbya sp. CCY1209]|uniref:mechanosensitive ion channel domain-containing protein n=1 Tax=Lyngbya sp. CCY1209 TaxID=2886103 RepID=UPI002D21506A|nr:mechanosensitive ion channel domain-containing protein [Lyngbya sp. CCY1209]MEB3883575.1 mechanosensitive ion channel [Lyngbya sp. CCY1209]